MQRRCQSAPYTCYTQNPPKIHLSVIFATPYLPIFCFPRLFPTNPCYFLPNRSTCPSHLNIHIPLSYQQEVTCINHEVYRYVRETSYSNHLTDTPTSYSTYSYFPPHVLTSILCRYCETLELYFDYRIPYTVFSVVRVTLSAEVYWQPRWWFWKGKIKTVRTMRSVL
jgi:hypothetical protein